MKYRIFFSPRAWGKISRAEEKDPRTQELQGYLEPIDVVRERSKLLGISPGSYIQGDAGPFFIGRGRIKSGEPINEIDMVNGRDVPEVVKQSCKGIIDFHLLD